MIIIAWIILALLLTAAASRIGRNLNHTPEA